MDQTNADQNAILGMGSPSDYDLLTGGSYSSAQDPFTANDDGTVNNAVTGTGTASAKGTVTPPAGGASYTPPAWLQDLTGLGAAANQAYTSVAPIIGGKPAPGPAAAGQQPAGAAKTVSGTIAGFPTKTVLIIAGIAALFFFWKKK